MRIISGFLGGRRFNPPADKWPTRPTTDFAKEALFNVLQNRIAFDNVKMLDLFGGTGSHCYEFISRGCNDVTYVDKFKPACNFVMKTATILEIDDKLTLRCTDVFKFIKSTAQQYDYIFAGPPYPLKNLADIPDEIFKHDLLTDDGLFVLEHNPDHNFEKHPNFKEIRKYGTCYFSFFDLL
jgi:16S rRNA (guanine966-N2)-methyltransferase